MTSGFWVLDPPMMVGATAFAEPVDATYGDAPTCAVCSKPIGPRRWIPPYKVRLRSGTRTDKPGDSITGPGFDGFLATTNLQAAYIEASLSGVIDWRPVEIVNWSGSPYRLTVLPDPTARADVARMDIEFSRSPDCSNCQQGTIVGYRGVVVDESTWNGDDIFLLMNLGLLVVTDRFKTIVDENEFTGLSFEPASNFTPAFARQRPAG
jgi:hypothetical protein